MIQDGEGYAGVRALAHAALVIVLAFVVGIGLGVVGTLVMAIRGAPIDPPSAEVLAITSILQYVGFLVVVGMYLGYTGDSRLVHRRLPTGRDIVWMVAGLIGVFVAVFAVGAVLAAIGADQAENTVVTQGVQHPELFLYMIPITMVFVAPGEELVFRGVVQGVFRRAYGPVVAIGAASILFGTSHYLALAGDGKLTYIAVTALLGALLGISYERTENVLVPICIHGAYNAILFASQWIVVTNDVPVPS